MTAAVEQPPAVELPPLTPEEVVLVQRFTSPSASEVTIREYIEFLMHRRRIVDALVREVYPEWPA